MQRRLEKHGQRCTFEIVAREWLALQKPNFSLVTYAKARWILEDLILPSLGKRPIATMRIGAHRMKMKEEHLVPLPRQAIEILSQLKTVSGEGRYLFPALTGHRHPMSESTVNAALRRLGYSSEERSGHGFRTLASTTLNELGWAPDLIELQLAHRDGNKVRDAYNRSARLAERAHMMQAWADYLDKLRLNEPASDAAPTGRPCLGTAHRERRDRVQSTGKPSPRSKLPLWARDAERARSAPAPRAG